MSDSFRQPAVASGAAAGAVPRSRAAISGEAALARHLRLLGDENRLRIFSLLTKAEMCVCEIEDVLELSQSLVSNHLAALRRAGLVTGRRDDEDARWVFYRAEPRAAAALRERLSALLEVRTATGDRRRAEQVCRVKGR
jgi:ArsR family transcriptional regulator